MFVVIFRYVRSFTPLMISRALEQKSEGKEMNAARLVSIEKISLTPKSGYCREDDLFLTHTA